VAGNVLITGSGRGIGAATARLAARRGWSVCINYLSRPGPAEQLLADIRASGGKAIALQADISKEEDVERLFAAVDRELGPLNALVNNAGITGRAGRLETFDLAAIRRVLDVNLTGALLCSQQAVKRMSTRRGGAGGAIVNVSSVAAVLGGANQWIPYAAAKGGINAMTIGLAKEVAAEGIRVNAIMPGLIDTEIHAEAGLGERLKTIVTQIPMGRVGLPEECAEAILWLMSGEAAYTVGAVLPMTGGR
jgi:NAD(P)-dependent dehydrogenase (short-subunit alcohol dehydrogenase family)